MLLINAQHGLLCIRHMITLGNCVTKHSKNCGRPLNATAYRCRIRILLSTLSEPVLRATVSMTEMCTAPAYPSESNFEPQQTIGIQGSSLFRDTSTLALQYHRPVQTKKSHCLYGKALTYKTLMIQ